MGYYGDDVFMTNCLVLVKETPDEDQIRGWLEKIGELNEIYESEPAMAVVMPGYRWIGIDSQSLQQNVSLKTVRETARIVGGTVILYDEFDDDILTVGYADEEKNICCCRYTAAFMVTLEDYGYEDESEFPEELLEFMEEDPEQVKKLWRSDEYDCEIEKMSALMRLMTKEPVPEIFVGKYFVESMPKEAKLIHFQAEPKIGSDGLDALTRSMKRVIPDLVVGINTLRNTRDLTKDRYYTIDLPESVWREVKPPFSNNSGSRTDWYQSDYGCIIIKSTIDLAAMNVRVIYERWNKTREQFAAEFSIPSAEILSYHSEERQGVAVRDYSILYHDQDSPYPYRRVISMANGMVTYSIEIELSTNDEKITEEIEHALKTFRPQWTDEGPCVK